MEASDNEQNIRVIVEAFKLYFTHVATTKTFVAKELHEFMEPYFERTGYRKTVQPCYGAKKSATNILILHESGAIGDFLVSSALMREIRRVYPQAHITLAMNDRLVELAAFCPYVNEIVAYAPGHSTDFGSVYKKSLILAQELLNTEYDLAFINHCGEETLSILTAYMAGAKKLVGCPTGFNGNFVDLLTVSVPLTYYGYHAVDACLGCLDKLLLAPVANRQTEVWYTDEDAEITRDLLSIAGDKIALCVGGSKRNSHYPPELYARLLKLLSQEMNFTLVILGGDKDIAEAYRIESLVDDLPTANLAGRLTLRQTAAALSYCDYCIGNDTATNHMAAAVQTPVLTPSTLAKDIVLPFVSTAQRWYPHGVPAVVVQPAAAKGDCRYAVNFRGCVSDEPHCIAQISPEAMFEAFKILRDRTTKKINEPLFFTAE